MNSQQFNKYFYEFKPDQQMIEMWQLVQKLNDLNPTIIIEIGLQYGGSSLLWNELVKENNGVFIGIETMMDRVNDELKKQSNVKLIKGKSCSTEVIATLEDFLYDKGRDYADFIFVDGSHNPDDVYNDMKIYSKFLISGGIMAVHDVARDIDGARIGLERFKKDNLIKIIEDGFFITGHGTYWLRRGTKD